MLFVCYLGIMFSDFNVLYLSMLLFQSKKGILSPQYLADKIPFL